jgi:NDP-sugar pyrophosphorylase family protein
MNVIIPMAGLGTRFPSEKYLPKPLIDVNGEPMIIRAIKSLGMPRDTHWYFIIRENQYTDLVKQIISTELPNAVFYAVTETTEGPASSALLFEEYIDNNEELIIANCDQIMEWNSSLFFHNVRLYDGAVVTYYSDTEKNSYVRINEQGLATELREKEVISNISLNGIHYWQRGSYFVKSAYAMIDADDRAPNGEFYIAPTYNYMIKAGQRVGIYHIPNEQHHAVGVPLDLERFIAYENSKTK